MALLAEGVERSDSPWRNPALVTAPAAPGQAPGVRTVVLRGLDEAARRITIHTDARSAKMRAIGLYPHCALHGWDSARQIQLRLSGAVAVLGPAETAAAWASLSAQTRSTYAVANAPGTPIGTPQEAGRQQGQAESRAVFTVLSLTFDRLDYLAIPHGAHRRALFAWTGSGALAATWLAP